MLTQGSLLFGTDGTESMSPDFGALASSQETAQKIEGGKKQLVLNLPC